MFWNDIPNKLAGAIVLLFIVLSVVSVFTSFSYMEANPFDRAEIDDFLTDLNDNEATAIASLVFDIASNMLALIVAGALYLVLRVRSRVLALFGFAGLFAAAVAGMAVSAGQETLIILADDFNAGGPGEIGAGDDVTLEVARAAAVFTLVLDQVAATALGIGLVAFGLLMARAPEAAGATPPRWIGWVACAAGLAFILSWLGVLAEPLFAFFIIAGPGLLISFIALGIWLLRAPEQASPAAARPSPQPA